jgi:hypothetical protein
MGCAKNMLLGGSWSRKGVVERKLLSQVKKAREMRMDWHDGQYHVLLYSVLSLQGKGR